MPETAPILILTRPAAQSNALRDRLDQRLAGMPRVIVSPILEIRPRQMHADVGSFDAIIFTSQNAVEVAAAQTDLAGKRAYCVGERTASRARDAGMEATSADGDVEALGELIAGQGLDQKLIHLHGAEVRGDLANALISAGIDTVSEVIYDQQPTPLDDEARKALQGYDPLVFPLYSPRSAALLGTAAQSARAPIILIAISTAAAQAWEGPFPEAIIVCRTPSGLAMEDTIAAYLGGSRLEGATSAG